MRLVVIHPTLLKLRPVDSSKLTESQRINLPIGSRVILQTYDDYDKDHYKVKSMASLSSGADKSMVWYVYKPHVKVLPYISDYAVIQLANDTQLNVRSAPDVNANNIIYKLKNNASVEVIDYYNGGDLWWLARPTEDQTKPFGWMSAKYLKLLSNEGCSA